MAVEREKEEYNMESYRILDEKGTFTLEKPENYSGLYFPLAGEQGMKSAIAPNLGGDCKLDQNSFLLEPVSIENLHNNRSTRNFWCHVKQRGSWSVTGASAEETAKRFTDCQDKSWLTAGLMWQTVTRRSDKYQLEAEVTSFAAVDENVEIMYVKLRNAGNMRVDFTPTAAIPIYGRSADNLRDHRHVTSLLHRITTTENGVLVTPTLSFDERGHQRNNKTYFVCGYMKDGRTPVDFYPSVEDYIGEGGSFDCPRAVIEDRAGIPAGSSLAGTEAMGGLRFPEVSLLAGESTSFTIVMGITEEPEKIPEITERYRTKEKTEAELLRVKDYWQKKVNVSCHTGDQRFDAFMYWVSFQPILRRIFGCSFLPHHDYGKGGRGWRDLWQDCLALLLMNPDGVRGMLLDNFGGVRMDGSNATIIGSRPGEFVADRNNITRVWMDHGVWPLMTTKLYIDQTGDIGILEEEIAYFKDKQAARGTKTDTDWNEEYGCMQKTKQGVVYKGTVLEHLLIQNLTAFYEVGEHGHMRLRGADWNDALDMAKERGESVAFTNAYAGNLSDLAELVEALANERKNRTGQKAAEDKEIWATVTISKELITLLTDDPALYDSIEEKQRLLAQYMDTCIHDIDGEKAEIFVTELAAGLRHKAEWIREHIRKTEWVEDAEGNGWFNGYYDDHGERVEGEFDSGVRMMLTGQVFSVMAGTASDDQIAKIAKSADRYLYKKELGGYRLNTDFGEVKLDLGRMFGFAYGEKENGAVFSHMAVMYANALYGRGYAKEGYKALAALYEQAMDFERSRIYPGIPEYFNGRGRGLYHYLTGAASWYMLTVITQMYGVRGELGNLMIEPKLLKEQFDANGEACLQLDFGGKHWNICYRNAGAKEYGEYRIAGVTLDGEELAMENIATETVQRGVMRDGASEAAQCGVKRDGAAVELPERLIAGLTADGTHQLEITLL